MKLKIYPEIGNPYFILLPDNIRTESEIDNWLDDHTRNVSFWELADKD